MAFDFFRLPYVLVVDDVCMSTKGEQKNKWKLNLISLPFHVGYVRSNWQELSRWIWQKVKLKNCVKSVSGIRYFIDDAEGEQGMLLSV